MKVDDALDYIDLDGHDVDNWIIPGIIESLSKKIDE
jgi:hypothetical protein